MLSNDDGAALLNGYSALWHPAALRGAAARPRLDSPYDHEQPVAGRIYAVPDSPPLVLPDDWDDRVRDAGAAAFRATADRQRTLDNLFEALRSLSQTELMELPPERAAPFFGVGFGCLVLDGLYEAMEHDKVLSDDDFWQDIQQAVGALGEPDAEAFRRPLQAAADKLLSAREVLYPVTIHLLDLAFLHEPLPGTFVRGLPLNVVACAAALEQFGREQPERFAALRERLHSNLLEVCGGPYQERDDALMPVESQLWNLLHGLARSKELLGDEIRVFARRRFGAHPQLPTLLNQVGLRKALLLAFDDGVLPTYRTPVVNWSAPDGKSVDAFTRTPYPADNPQTWLHWAHYLHKTIMQDHTATLAVLHGAATAAPWYDDLLELSRFGPVLGQWTTLSRFLSDILAGEYLAPLAADDLHGDYLSDRINAKRGDPVTGFVQQTRLRRRLDTAWTLAGLYRGLAGTNDTLGLAERLAAIENQVESNEKATDELTAVEQQAAQALADRMLSRAAPGVPGLLVLNPCSYTRRIALEVDGVMGTLPQGGPLKACQVHGTTGRMVVEVPALGFAWVPRSGNAPLTPARMRLADERCVRNEFFEAEIDPTTGGLKSLRDHRTRSNRIGQQLVFNPGSIMLAKSITVTSSGPALGEIICDGVILDEQEKALATYRQRYRAWLGRPLLELRIEIHPESPPEGYPWFAYYGARFAWRDEREAHLRGVNGTAYVTTTHRPETPDFLEWRRGRQSTFVFPGGLPFHQLHGGRMLDVVLLPEGETGRSFDLALALDRDYPMQTAQGIVTPAVAVPVEKGPPHVGAAGWLFHLNAPNLLLTTLRPVPGADAVVARLIECAAHAGQAELRCARDPQRALLIDAQGTPLLDGYVSGDAATFETAAGEIVQLRVEFEV